MFSFFSHVHNCCSCGFFLSALSSMMGLISLCGISCTHTCHVGLVLPHNDVRHIPILQCTFACASQWLTPCRAYCKCRLPEGGDNALPRGNGRENGERELSGERACESFLVVVNFARALSQMPLCSHLAANVVDSHHTKISSRSPMLPSRLRQRRCSGMQCTKALAKLCAGLVTGSIPNNRTD